MQQCQEGRLRELLTNHTLSEVLSGIEQLYATELLANRKSKKRLEALAHYRTGVAALRQIVQKIEADTGCTSKLTDRAL